MKSTDIPVFPVRVFHDGKKWQKQPLCKWQDERKPRAEWNGTWPAEANAAGVVPADIGYFVLDVDIHRGGVVPDGLPATFQVQTPSGGFHFWFETAEEFSNSKGSLPDGLDIRSAKGWVPLPSSCTLYKVLDTRKAAPLPKFIAEQVRRLAREALPAVVEDLDNPDDVARARHALDAIIARVGAIGEHDPPETYPHICAIKDLGVSQQTCLDLFCDALGEHERDWLAGQVANAYSYGQNEPGAKALPPKPAEWDTADLHTAEWWLKRELLPAQKLIGPMNLGSKGLLVGPTGAGKTMLALAIAGAVATGTSVFPNLWSAPYPRRVLMIDGEMPQRMLKRRLAQLIDRIGPTHGRLAVVSTRDLGFDPPPLNYILERGKATDWLDLLIKHHEPDFLILDNLQCLTVGDHRDTAIWQNLLPWVRKTEIAQLWLHHANDDGRQYGDKTRSWGLDLEINLARVNDAAGIEVDLSYAKARELEPGVNSAEYQTGRVRFAHNKWEFQTHAAREYQEFLERPHPVEGQWLKAAEFAKYVGVSRPAVSQGKRWRRYLGPTGLYDLALWLNDLKRAADLQYDVLPGPELSPGEPSTAELPAPEPRPDPSPKPDL